MRFCDYTKIITWIFSYLAVCDKRNYFCFICGLFADKKHRLDFKNNKALVNSFNAFFNQSYVFSKWYEPECVCITCSIALKQCKSRKFKKQPLPFSLPMVWHRQIFHKPDDCYFCQTNIDGFQFRNRNRINYANVCTVSKPVLKTIEDDETSTKEHLESGDETSDEMECDQTFVAGSVELHLVTNEDLHDLMRDLKLSWRQTEMLASRLKQWKITESDLKVTFARDNPQMCFEQIFKADDDDNNLIYCSDIDDLFHCLNHQHQPNDWRLFLDGSCKS